MADLVPVAPVVPRSVTSLREVIAAADQQRQELAEAGDLDSLAAGLAQLRQIAGDLRLLSQAVEDDVARLMPEKRYTLEGVGTLERRRGSVRKSWQSDELVHRIVADAIIEPTGELRHDSLMAAVVAVVEALVECAPFTPSMGWRVTALRAHGIDPDEWCESTPGRTTIQVHGEQEQQ